MRQPFPEVEYPGSDRSGIRKVDEGGTSSKVGDAEGNCNTNLERLDLNGRQARNLCRSCRSRMCFWQSGDEPAQHPFRHSQFPGIRFGYFHASYRGSVKVAILAMSFQLPLLKAGHPDASRERRNQIPWLAQPSDIGLECDASERNRSLVGSVSVQRRGRRPVSLPNVR